MNNPSHQYNAEYYDAMATIFNELSGQSHFFNLGYREPGQHHITPAELQRQLVRQVAAHGQFTSAMNVLEVGCGLGGPAQLIAKAHGCRITGIDPSPYQVTHANAWLRDLPAPPAVTVLYGDGQFIPFRANFFDRVYSIESAFHYPDKPQFLREAARVLKPEGKIVIADILKSSRPTTGWLNSQIRESIAADHFFNLDAYRQAAAESGLMLINHTDITAGVARTFSVWLAVFLQKFRRLLPSYSLRSLTKIGLALCFARLLIAVTGFSYQIMVFEKKEGTPHA
jgi:avermectin B 5-O-methyltransferase